MADANVNAVVHPVKAAWKEVWGIQGEASSLVELWDGNPDAESWAFLADSVLSRMNDAIEALERAYSQSGMSPLTHYENGGMGAVAPMVTQEVDSQSIAART